MANNDPRTARTDPLAAPGGIEDPNDPDGGQVMGPHGEAPVDPAAKALYRGCLTMLVVLAIFLALFSVLYRLFVAE